VKQRSYFKDIMSVFGSNLAVTACSLLIGIILSRILGAAGYGLYSSIIVVPLIVIGFTQIGIRRATMYHLGARKLEEDSIVSAVFILLLITSFLSVVISGLVFLFSESRNSDPLQCICRRDLSRETGVSAGKYIKCRPGIPEPGLCDPVCLDPEIIRKGSLPGFVSGKFLHVFLRFIHYQEILSYHMEVP
jgi:hypothetical protein